VAINIVSAKREHAPLIAWVMLAAARSHTDTSIWEVIVDRDEAAVLEFLEALTTSADEHMGHFTAFSVLEVDGTPAAAMCGYLDAESGFHRLVPAAAVAGRAIGMSDDEFAAGMGRIAPFGRVTAEHPQGAWIVEFVATQPEFRRQGHVDRLIAHTLDNGRARGATIGDIGVFIGNDSAQQAYEKNGFSVVEEHRDPEFEAVFHTPGIRQLRRAI
jgi:translation initiation factor 4G